MMLHHTHDRIQARGNTIEALNTIYKWDAMPGIASAGAEILLGIRNTKWMTSKACSDYVDAINHHVKRIKQLTSPRKQTIQGPQDACWQCTHIIKDPRFNSNDVVIFYAQMDSDHLVHDLNIQAAVYALAAGSTPVNSVTLYVTSFHEYIK
jgi:hypothetical protein